MTHCSFQRSRSVVFGRCPPAACTRRCAARPTLPMTRTGDQRGLRALRGRRGRSDPTRRGRDARPPPPAARRCRAISGRHTRTHTRRTRCAVRCSGCRPRVVLRNNFHMSLTLLLSYSSVILASPGVSSRVRVASLPGSDSLHSVQTISTALARVFNSLYNNDGVSDARRRQVAILRPYLRHCSCLTIVPVSFA